MNRANLITSISSSVGQEQPVNSLCRDTTVVSFWTVVLAKNVTLAGD